jgi:hypothetical protein
MNLFVFFGDGLGYQLGKMTEILHHALRAMMQFPVIFPRVIIHHQTKK